MTSEEHLRHMHIKNNKYKFSALKSRFIYDLNKCEKLTVCNVCFQPYNLIELDLQGD